MERNLATPFERVPKNRRIRGRVGLAAAQVNMNDGLETLTFSTDCRPA